MGWKSKYIIGVFLVLGLVGATPSNESLTIATPVSFSQIEKVITLEFKAEFLEAGLQNLRGRRGNEIHFSEIDWKSPTEGSALARIWNVSSRIHFKTDPDKKKIQNIQYNSKPGSPTNTWKVWRHRHAYLFIPGKGYFWNSLENERPEMGDKTGAFFDEYLKELWSYWIMRKLPSQPEFENGDREKDVMKKHVQIRYDEAGLNQALIIPFQINLWHMPVKISFEVKPSSGPVHGYRNILLAGDYTWSYNRSEWRRRHGYQKNFIGQYKVDSNWPEERHLTKADGRRLDELLDRAVAYWVEVSIHMVLADLSNKVYAAASKTRSDLH